MLLSANSRMTLCEESRSIDPEVGFDREWALETVARALKTQRAEWEATGRVRVFEELKGSLTGSEPDRTEVAERLGMTEGSVKVAVHRLRQRYRELLRAEIAETVVEASEIEEEMRHLVSVLRAEQGLGL